MGLTHYGYYADDKLDGKGYAIIYGLDSFGHHMIGIEVKYLNESISLSDSYNNKLIRTIYEQIGISDVIQSKATIIKVEYITLIDNVFKKSFKEFLETIGLSDIVSIGVYHIRRLKTKFGGIKKSLLNAKTKLSRVWRDDN